LRSLFSLFPHPFADSRFGGLGGAKKQPKKAPEKQQKTNKKNRTENPKISPENSPKNKTPENK
jgi:hypothetical protein